MTRFVFLPSAIMARASLPALFHFIQSVFSCVLFPVLQVGQLFQFCLLCGAGLQSFLTQKSLLLFDSSLEER